MFEFAVFRSFRLADNSEVDGHKGVNQDLAALWRQSLFSTVMLLTANGGVVGELSRLGTMSPSVRPIERGMREPRRIRKVLCFPRNLVATELHDAHGVGRLAVICQDEFGDPKRTGANDSSDRKPLFARLTGALVLYVASTAGSLT